MPSGPAPQPAWAYGPLDGESWHAPPWADHIKGTAKIGPLPFVDNFNVGYGAIDIDIYPAKHNDYIKKLQELEIHRYIMVRSSSGGAHIFFCFKEPIAAWLVVRVKYGFCDFRVALCLLNA